MDEPTSEQPQNTLTASTSKPKRDADIYWKQFLTIFLFTLVIILGILFYFNWKNLYEKNDFKKSSIVKEKLDSISVNGTYTSVPDSLLVFKKCKLHYRVDETKLIFLIIIMGAFGAILHAMVSFGVFVGNNSFDSKWSIWYLFRPFVGAVLALLFYFLIRAGFIPSIHNDSDIYTILVIGGLAGMFSKQAQEKLGDIFDVLFQSKKPEQYSGKLVKDNTAPKINSVNPDSVEAGPDDVSITITGSGFIKSSVVRINQLPVTTEFASSTELKAIISDLDQYKTDSLRVRVFNGTPGGGLSEAVVIKLVKPAAPDQPGIEPAG